jgi:hypothetical protein
MRHLLVLLLFLVPAYAFATEILESNEAEFSVEPPHKDPPGDYPAPGNMGPNAFYFFWHLDDARVVGDQIFFNLSYRPSLDLRHEWTNAGVMSVVIPFSEFASIEFSEMVERWNLNDQGMADYASRTRSGTTLDDFIATVKFNVLKEAKYRPAITLKGVIKTANGSAEDGRNTDSAGYVIGAQFAKDVLTSAGVLQKIRLLAEIDFFAWDDARHAQDDAYCYAFASQFVFKKGLTVETGIHGFTGWHDNGDRPLTAYAEARKAISPRVTAYASVDLGINSKTNASTNPVMVSAGVRIGLNRKYPRK